MLAYHDDPWADVPPPDAAPWERLPLARGEMRTRPSLASRLLNRDDLSRLPVPEPLIHETIDRRTVAVIAGHYGTCKSFIAQDWAACLATSKAWQGRPVPAQPGRVLYVAAEGAFGLDQRLTAWEYAWSNRRPIPGELLQVIPAPVNLMRDDEVAELCELAKATDLVVIDTLARCLVGADENSAKDIGLAVDSLYRVRDATGDGTVLALHHTGKDRSTIRGSSALEDGVDTVYLTEGDTRNLRLSRTKRKDGPRDDVLQLRLNAVEGTSSAVISRLMEGVRMNDSEDKIVSHLRSHYGGLGASRKELVDTSEIAQPTVYRAVTALVRAGVLRSETKGSTTKFYLNDDD